MRMCLAILGSLSHPSAMHTMAIRGANCSQQDNDRFTVLLCTAFGPFSHPRAIVKDGRQQTH